MNRLFRLSVIASVAILFVLGGIASAGTLEEISKRGELRVACQTQGAPFSFVDKNGDRTGSSVTATENVRTDYEVDRRVKRPVLTNDLWPPAVRICGPGQRMAD